MNNDFNKLHDELSKYLVMSRYFEKVSPYNTYQEIKEQEQKALETYKGIKTGINTVQSNLFTMQVKKDVANIMKIFIDYLESNEANQ